MQRAFTSQLLNRRCSTAQRHKQRFLPIQAEPPQGTTGFASSSCSAFLLIVCHLTLCKLDCSLPSWYSPSCHETPATATQRGIQDRVCPGRLGFCPRCALHAHAALLLHRPRALLLRDGVLVAADLHVLGVSSLTLPIFFQPCCGSPRHEDKAFVQSSFRPWMTQQRCGRFWR